MKNLLLGLVFVVSTFAHADWQGDFVISKQDSGMGRPARIYVKGNKIRIDMHLSGRGDGKDKMAPSRVIQDAATKRMLMINDNQKTFFEMPASKESFGVQSFLPCLSANHEECFKREGLKKVSDQTWEGHPCEVYEGRRQDGGTQQIWRAKDLKEVPFVRITSVENGKQTEETHLENIKTSSIPADFFAIPAGYTKNDPMAEAMKNIPPEQRAKLLEMMKKRGQ